MTTKTFKPVTGLHHFHTVNPAGDTLFSVRQGVPMGEAFNHLTALLHAAKAAAEGVAMCEGSEPAPGAAWGVYHLLDLAFELSQAMHTGICNHERALMAPDGAGAAPGEVRP